MMVIASLGCASKTVGGRAPQSEELSQGLLFTDQKEYPKIDNLVFRTGMFLEAQGGPFKGCVIYLEGFGDSVLNHIPLYTALSTAGYRTIFYDYAGQGGSTGTMHSTRLRDPVYAPREIGEQAKWLWDIYSKKIDPVYHRSCEGQPHRVIGWSTGGLAAYKLAYEKWTNSVVLIAPGLSPKIFVGESANDWERVFTFRNTLSLLTLTRNRFTDSIDPHQELPKPDSPAKVPLFAKNLLLTACEARGDVGGYCAASEARKDKGWTIPPSVHGLVFFSSDDDTYVDSDKAEQVLKKYASQFGVIRYEGALHELDNELPEVATDLRKKTIEFFDRN
jgi:alpha-beta hydrolase superfamily lysophospholipase